MTGSPRAKGNSNALAEEFIKAAQESGNIVNRIDAANSGVTGCIACDTCWNQGVPCSVDDHFNKIAPLIQQADVYVFVFPLYWYSIPAQIKAVIDKMYCLGSSKSPTSLKDKEYIVIVSGEESKEKAYQGTLKSFESIADFLHWTEQNRLIAGGLGPVGAVETSPYLAQAFEMGKNI